MYNKNVILSVFQVYNASQKDKEMSRFVFEIWFFFNKVEWIRESQT